MHSYMVGRPLQSGIASLRQSDVSHYVIKRLIGRILYALLNATLVPPARGKARLLLYAVAIALT